MQIDNIELPVEEIAQLYGRDPLEIRDAYEEWFDLRRGRQRPTAPDIRLLASLSNLSTTSVSNFLRNKPGSLSAINAQRMAQLIEMVGYVPSSAAQSLRGRQTNVIGIALPLSSVSPDFYLEILLDTSISSSMSRPMKPEMISSDLCRSWGS
jgi:hypothetical protein